MLCSTNNPAQKRFFFRFVVAMVVYGLLLIPAVWGFIHYRPTGVLAYVLAILPALAIIGMLVVIGLYLAEEKDEFIRNAQVQSLLGGMGLTLALVSVWGFLENFVHVGRLDLFLVYPIFWGFVGLSTIVVWLKNR